MKRLLLAAVAVLLVAPAGAAARLPDGPINSPQIHSSSLGAGPTAGPRQDLRMPDRRVSSVLPSHLTALGTDVAASDQRSPQQHPVAIRVSAPAPGFAWGAAAIGAGGMIALLALALGTVGTVRRRHTRQPWAATS